MSMITLTLDLESYLRYLKLYAHLLRYRRSSFAGRDFKYPVPVPVVIQTLNDSDTRSDSFAIT